MFDRKSLDALADYIEERAVITKLSERIAYYEKFLEHELERNASPYSGLMDIIRRQQALLEKAVEALRPFGIYATKREEKPVSQLGDSVHQIHAGTKWGASITFSDCKVAQKILQAIKEAM